jgi:hypothetical protein
MWTIIKIDRKKIHLLMKDFEDKLGSPCEIYKPKIEIQHYKNNKIINKKLDLLGDYIFCFNKNFAKSSTLNFLKFSTGLKYFLQGHSLAQFEINNFVKKCKKMENDRGYIIENIFSLDVRKRYKFSSGPFTGKLFKILELNKNKLSILIGNFKTELNKKEYLFNPA